MSHVLSDDEGNRSLSPLNSGGEREKENSDNEQTEGRRIDPSTSGKKIIRKPLPKLNPARLKGPKGVATIEKYFEGFKYHGKGYEKSDLNRIMKRLEHWGHRLFPKYQFDDFLEKVEALGTKKELQVHLIKYRRDMLTDDLIEEGEENEEERAKSPEAVDEFDLLIAEQIEKTRHASRDNSMIDEEEETKKRMEANRKMAMERKLAKMREKEESQSDPKIEESEEEIRKRIEKNRQMALERKNARMRQKEAEIEKKMEEIFPEKERIIEETQEMQVEDLINEEQEKEPENKEKDEEIIEEPEEMEEENIIDEDNSVSVPEIDDSKNASKLLTNEELDREIGAAVEMFMKKKR